MRRRWPRAYLALLIDAKLPYHLHASLWIIDDVGASGAETDLILGARHCTVAGLFTAHGQEAAARDYRRVSSIARCFDFISFLIGSPLEPAVIKHCLPLHL